MSSKGRGKSFREAITPPNPVTQFITSPTEGKEPEEQIIAQTSFVPVLKQKETKSQHLHLILKPSQVKRLKENADRAGLSVNEFISQLLDHFLDDEQKSH